MSLDIKYECPIHSTQNVEINAQNCYIEMKGNGDCIHVIKFQIPVKINPVWNEFDLKCIRNIEDACIGVIETFYNCPSILCPISYLRKDTELRLIVNCIQSLISLLSDLDQRDLCIYGHNKKIISPNILYNVMLNLRSDGTIILTHKYLLSKNRNKKRCLSLLPRTLLYFLCRDTKVNQLQCGINCKLKKKESFFTEFQNSHSQLLDTEFSSELLHQCFCEPNDINNQITRIINIFDNIE